MKVIKRVKKMHSIFSNMTINSFLQSTSRHSFHLNTKTLKVSLELLQILKPARFPYLKDFERKYKIIIFEMHLRVTFSMPSASTPHPHPPLHPCKRHSNLMWQHITLTIDLNSSFLAPGGYSQYT